MRVWIDQDLCTGDGLCLDHAPDVFVQLEDGIAYVADTCPGECIFIELDPASAATAAAPAA